MKIYTTYITKAASLLTIATGLFVLVGFFLRLPSFGSLSPGVFNLKFNSGVCFILSGIALYLLDEPVVNKLQKIIAFVCAGIVLLIGVLTLSQYIFG